jgi:hypothetical protein
MKFREVSLLEREMLREFAEEDTSPCNLYIPPPEEDNKCRPF